MPLERDLPPVLDIGLAISSWT